MSALSEALRKLPQRDWHHRLLPEEADALRDEFESLAVEREALIWWFGKSYRVQNPDSIQTPDEIYQEMIVSVLAAKRVES
jgi:hypothetical protein